MPAIQPQPISKIKLNYSRRPEFVQRITEVYANGTTITKDRWLKMLDELDDDTYIYHLSIYRHGNPKEPTTVKVFAWDAPEQYISSIQ